MLKFDRKDFLHGSFNWIFQDILEFEKQSFPTLPISVYEVLAASTKKYSDRTALHFFLQGTT